MQASRPHFGLSVRSRSLAFAVLIPLLVGACSAGATSSSASPSSAVSSSSPASPAASSAASPAASASGTVNIGVIAGFTGSYVSFSDSLLNGVQVAAALINQSGGILGQKANVIPVNDGLDPTDTVPAVQKMLAVDNVKLCSCLAALDYEAGLPVLNKAKMVSVSYIGPDYGPTVMPYHWNMNPSDSQLGIAMAYYAHQKGYTKIALVFDSSLGAQSVVPSIVAAAKKLNIQIVAQPTVPENASSYQVAIDQVINAHPQAVLMQVEPAQSGAFFQQWQSQGAGGLPVVGTDFMIDQETLKAAGSTEIPHMVFVEGLQRTSSPFYKTFVSDWGTIIKHPFSYVGAFLYDGTVMAALAMDEAHSTDPTVYYKYIDNVTQPASSKTTVYSYAQGVAALAKGEQIKYSGITGPLIFNKYHRPTGDYGIYTVASPSANPSQIGTISADKLVGLGG